MKTQQNITSDFERALQERGDQEYVLRLYVAGMSPRSLESIAAIRKFCEEHLPGRYEITVVDIYQHPKLAREKQILAAPTLVKEMPLPLRKLIGGLLNVERVLNGLDIHLKSEHREQT